MEIEVLAMGSRFRRKVDQKVRSSLELLFGSSVINPTGPLPSSEKRYSRTHRTRPKDVLTSSLGTRYPPVCSNMDFCRSIHTLLTGASLPGRVRQAAGILAQAAMES